MRYYTLQLSILFLIAAIFFVCSTYSTGNIHTVGLSGSEDFSTIHYAINQSQPYDTIAIFEGEYQENLVVDKPLIIQGNSTWNTHIIGEVSENVVTIDELGHYDTNGTSRAIKVNENLAYIADEFNGLLTFDISDPSVPLLLSHNDSGGSAIELDIKGDYLYLANGDGGLAIYNVSDPSSPSLISTLDTDGYSFDIEVTEEYAFVADHSNGLVIINITDPYNPGFMSQTDTGNAALGIDVVGDVAFVSNSEDGLILYNISDVMNPSLISRYDTDRIGKGNP